MKNKKHRVLVVDDEIDICRALEFLLIREGYDVETVQSGEAALKKLERRSFDLVLSDLRMDGMDGIELLGKVKAADPLILFIIMTAFATVESAVEVMKMGAEDYIVKPFVNDDVMMRIGRLLNYRSLSRENEVLRRELGNRVSKHRFIGDSHAVRELFRVIDKVVPTRSNILMLGESGTGKGVLAEIIHSNGPRAEEPFLAINCSAIPETLLESELFGYRKGAFTGADSDKLGLISAADSGTLFLDEIGDMPLATQAKILKVIEQGEVMRLGDTKPMAVDVRFIAATHRNLPEAVSKGIFREDLYYRLNVIEVSIPPLRDRRDDIPVLVQHFMAELASAHHVKVGGIEESALEALKAYNWPGNVRELRNSIERAVVLHSGGTIALDDFPRFASAGANTGPSQAGGTLGGTLKDLLDRHEKKLIEDALSKHQWNKEQTAKDLGIDLATLYRKMKRYSIEQ
jgi:DNA-binding NtrC family response regulator